MLPRGEAAAASWRSDLRGDVLTLTLDTPGGAVNVLTRDAASSLHALVSGVDPSAVRALVLRSGKPRSFVNGVGLMLSGTVKSVDEAARLTAPVRDAYRALRTCPVPTFAAIRGNCYGCGVELTLQCRYRLASDERDTRFYMTELADYLMIPTFGSTQDLPRLLGLESAVEFLLWGQRWSARQAFERGLVDGCFDPDAFDREVDAFVDRHVTASKKRPLRPARRVSASELDGIRATTGDRIRRLPPDSRDLYTTGFGLMEEAATQDGDAGYARESLEAARSALAAPSRAATPFFFMRQAAKSLVLADCPGDARAAVAFEATEPAVAALCAELTGRERPPAAGALRLARYVATGDPGDPPGPGEEGRVAVSDRLSGRPFDERQGVVMHAPFRALGIEVVEVTSGSAPSPAGKRLSAALADRYFTVVPTRPNGLFVLDELLLAWLAPQIAYLKAGGAPADLAASLRGFGFTRLPGDWVGALGAAALRDLVALGAPDGVPPGEALLALPTSSCEGGEGDPAVIRAILASLCGFVARALRDRCLRHVTFADVAARDVIDFPLGKTSLCRHLTLARCGELLSAQATFRHYVATDTMSSFEEFAARGRAFYQGNAHR